MPAPAQVATGTADPPWPSPAECYLAALASVTSLSIGADGGTVEPDAAQIIAAVAQALLRAGRCRRTAPCCPAGPQPRPALPDGGSCWRTGGAPAPRRGTPGRAGRAGLAVRLPLRQATAVIESIAAHEDLV